MTTYIRPPDYRSLGIADATARQVSAASRIVDGQIGRPAGLLWSPDATGSPGWMATKTPTRVVKIAGALAPGASTIIPLNHGLYGFGDIGSSVVIDRKNPEACEACTISAASGNTITLYAQFAHEAGATVEFGLAISEESPVVYGGMFRFNSRPVARVLGVTGNYGGGVSIADRLLTIGRGGNPWNPFPLDQCDVDDAQGSCWLLPGDARGGFTRVRAEYIAGWSYEALPHAIKQATANIVRNAIDSEMSGNVKLLKAGNATIERFSASMVDADTLSLLMPYRNIRL